jgi:hypothetical protein
MRLAFGNAKKWNFSRVFAESAKHARECQVQESAKRFGILWEKRDMTVCAKCWEDIQSNADITDPAQHGWHPAFGLCRLCYWFTLFGGAMEPGYWFWTHAYMGTGWDGFFLLPPQWPCLEGDEHSP